MKIEKIRFKFYKNIRRSLINPHTFLYLYFIFFLETLPPFSEILITLKALTDRLSHKKKLCLGTSMHIGCFPIFLISVPIDP